MEKICKGCGKKFVLGTYRKKYCSTQCQKKFKHVKPLIKRHCGYCGEIFTVEHNGSKITRLNYCSKDCAEKNRNTRTVKSIYESPKYCKSCGVLIENHKPHQKYCSISCGRKIHYLPRHCKFCGGLFIPHTHQQLTCCKEHSSLWNSHRCSKIEYDKKYNKTCLYCGKKYISTAHQSKFCNNLCQGKYHRKMMTDNYILERLTVNSILHRTEISKSYIEAKRAQLKLLRAIK